MHVFRQRAKANREKVDFANHFCQTLGLPSVFMGFVDVYTKRIVESWSGRNHDSEENCVNDLAKATKLRLALHFTIEPQHDTTVPDIMDGDHVWISAGCYRICVGAFDDRLAPFIAFKECPDQDPDIPQTVLKMGMAYVQLQLNQMRLAQAAWQENILKSTTQALCINMAVVSSSGEIVHDGRRRRDGVGCVSGLKIENNRFLANAEDLAALHHAVADATSVEQKTSTVSIRGKDDSSQLLLVTPLVNSSSPLALILFETEELDHGRMCETFFDAYDLTPSERRVAHSIIGGGTVNDTAQQTGLSVATVRSYMKQIFAKTNTHRQSELISLYYQAILPIATRVGTLGRVRH